jgi:hypothetical protein
VWGYTVPDNEAVMTPDRSSFWLLDLASAFRVCLEFEATARNLAGLLRNMRLLTVDKLERGLEGEQTFFADTSQYTDIQARISLHLQECKRDSRIE